MSYQTTHYKYDAKHRTCKHYASILQSIRINCFFFLDERTSEQTTVRTTAMTHNEFVTIAKYHNVEQTAYANTHATAQHSTHIVAQKQQYQYVDILRFVERKAFFFPSLFATLNAISYMFRNTYDLSRHYVDIPSNQAMNDSESKFQIVCSFVCVCW